MTLNLRRSAPLRKAGPPTSELHDQATRTTCERFHPHFHHCHRCSHGLRRSATNDRRRSAPARVLRARGREPRGRKPVGNEPGRHQSRGRQSRRRQPRGCQPRRQQPRWHEPRWQQPRRNQPRRHQSRRNQPRRHQPRRHQSRRNQPRRHQPRRHEPRRHQPQRDEPDGDEPRRRERRRGRHGDGHPPPRHRRREPPLQPRRSAAAEDVTVDRARLRIDGLPAPPRPADPERAYLRRAREAAVGLRGRCRRTSHARGLGGRRVGRQELLHLHPRRAPGHVVAGRRRLHQEHLPLERAAHAVDRHRQHRCERCRRPDAQHDRGHVHGNDGDGGSLPVRRSGRIRLHRGRARDDQRHHEQPVHLGRLFGMDPGQHEPWPHPRERRQRVHAALRGGRLLGLHEAGRNGGHLDLAGVGQRPADLRIGRARRQLHRVPLRTGTEARAHALRRRRIPQRKVRRAHPVRPVRQRRGVGRIRCPPRATRAARSRGPR